MPEKTANFLDTTMRVPAKSPIVLIWDVSNLATERGTKIVDAKQICAQKLAELTHRSSISWAWRDGPKPAVPGMERIRVDGMPQKLGLKIVLLKSAPLQGR